MYHYQRHQQQPALQAHYRSRPAPPSATVTSASASASAPPGPSTLPYQQSERQRMPEPVNMSQSNGGAKSPGIYRNPQLKHLSSYKNGNKCNDFDEDLTMLRQLQYSPSSLASSKQTSRPQQWPGYHNHSHNHNQRPFSPSTSPQPSNAPLKTEPDNPELAISRPPQPVYLHPLTTPSPPPLTPNMTVGDTRVDGSRSYNHILNNHHQQSQHEQQNGLGQLKQPSVGYLPHWFRSSEEMAATSRSEQQRRPAPSAGRSMKGWELQSTTASHLAEASANGERNRRDYDEKYRRQEMLLFHQRQLQQQQHEHEDRNNMVEYARELEHFRRKRHRLAHAASWAERPPPPSPLPSHFSHNGEIDRELGDRLSHSRLAPLSPSPSPSSTVTSTHVESGQSGLMGLQDYLKIQRTRRGGGNELAENTRSTSTPSGQPTRSNRIPRSPIIPISSSSENESEYWPAPLPSTQAPAPTPTPTPTPTSHPSQFQASTYTSSSKASAPAPSPQLIGSLSSGKDADSPNSSTLREDDDEMQMRRKEDGDEGPVVDKSKTPAPTSTSEEPKKAKKGLSLLDVDVDFAESDLALATVPGMDFDPRSRTFSSEELKPQPIIRKKGKVYVSQEDKDEKYWSRRIKNNVAARRSREARRLKENQIALRASYLEKENQTLKGLLKQLSEENREVKQDLGELAQKISRLEKRVGGGGGGGGGHSGEAGDAADEEMSASDNQ